jgi:arabinofuranosyltransferase
LPQRLDRSRTLLVLGVVAAAGLLVAHALARLDYTVDDAFISFRYGRNLAEGLGLVFNPGERVEGYSNLAWTLLFAGLYRLGGDPVLSIKLAGVALGALSLPLAVALARDAARSTAAALFTGFLLAGNVFLAVWLGAGLETPLFSFELLAMVVCATRRRRAAYGATAALCCLTRPDGVAMAGLVAAERLFSRRRLELWWAWPPLAAVAQLLFRLSYYGDWVPNTARVKLGGGLPELLQGVGWIFHLFLDWSLGLGLVAVPLATWWLWRNESVRLCLVLVAGYLAFLVSSGGDFFAYYRLAVPILPLLTVLVVAAGTEAGRRAVRHGHPPRAVWAALAVLALAGLVLLPLWTTQRDRARVGRETRMLHHFSKPAARWLAAHSPPGSTIALTVAGAIPYYSGLRTIDRFGLCDAEIARAQVPWQDVRSGISKYDPDSVLRREPDWILLDVNEARLRATPPQRLERRMHAADRALLARPRFRREYRLVDRWIGRPRDRLALYLRRGSPAEDPALFGEP